MKSSIRTWVKFNSIIATDLEMPWDSYLRISSFDLNKISLSSSSVEMVNGLWLPGPFSSFFFPQVFCVLFPFAPSFSLSGWFSWNIFRVYFFDCKVFLLIISSTNSKYSQNSNNKCILVLRLRGLFIFLGKNFSNFERFYNEGLLL